MPRDEHLGQGRSDERLQRDAAIEKWGGWFAAAIVALTLLLGTLNAIKLPIKMWLTNQGFL